MSVASLFAPPAAGTPPAFENPRPELLAGGALMALFLVGFVGWSALAPLDAAVHAPGVVRVAGNRQAVQSETGGTISAIRVHEGDRVRAGQILVEFATTQALAQERSLASRVFGLQAEVARIDAERRGADEVAMPVEWTTLTPEDRAEAERALAGEQANLRAARGLLASQRAVLQQRIVQVGEQIDGYRERQSSNVKQDRLNGEELKATQTLFAHGYAPKTRVLALQRQEASLEGEMGATSAEMARLRSSAGETRLQMMQLADERLKENSDRLGTAATELQTVLPQWQAARDQLEKTRLRAPVSGMVIGLAANTVGGVSAPGQKLMEIVPSTGALVVEAQVGLGDANDMHAGQKAEVNIGGLRGRHLPPLHGTVTRVSADSLTDERSGHSYFTATVGIPRAELDRVSRRAGLAGIVKSGTPVDVTVTLRSRTALQYFTAPLFSRFAGALSDG